MKKLFCVVIVAVVAAQLGTAHGQSRGAKASELVAYVVASLAKARTQEAPDEKSQEALANAEIIRPFHAVRILSSK